MKKQLIIGVATLATIGVGIWLSVQHKKPVEQTVKSEQTNTQPTDQSMTPTTPTALDQTIQQQPAPQPTEPTKPKSTPKVQQFAELARTHIDPGTPHDPYNSNPPTSGPHWPNPANWGVYSSPLVDEQAIHNLEHGGIWISYKNIDDQTKAKLVAIAQANPGCVILSPRNADDSKIVLASWTRLLKLDSFDEAIILDYIKTYKNQSPEPLAQ